MHWLWQLASRSTLRSSATRITFRLSRSRQLEALEAVERRLDPGLVRARRAVADPGPFLHQELARRAVGLEVDGGDDGVAGQHRQREIAEHPLLLRHIGLEAVVVAEEEVEPLALDDERVE